MVVAYNLFRSGLHGIYCAVPEDTPVPAFISGESWEFIEKIASEGVRFQGFFIFHPFEAEKLVA